MRRRPSMWRIAPAAIPSCISKRRRMRAIASKRDAVGESVILTEMVASSGQALSFLDTSAQAGVLYTYRIIPIHEELLQQGVWLEGKQAVQLAQVRAGSGMISGLRSLIPALAVQHK